MPTPTDLVCPACGAELASDHDKMHCPRCRRHYPVVAGIPDLRLRPDRYLDLEADRAKARRLVESGPDDFRGLVRHYWGMTPEVPPHLAERYTANVVAGPQRAQVHLDALDEDVAGRRLLDVGCGTGGLLVAAASRGAASVTGVDIALRWLVVAARQLREQGVDARLIAADGGALPFRDGSFDVVTCVETVEHAEHPADVVAGCVRAAGRGGSVYVVATNRWSAAPEPHVGLWGVGLLPRRLAPAYVRWRAGTGYRYVRPVSPPELRRMAPAGEEIRVRAAALPPPGPDASRLRVTVQRLYDAVRRVPGLRRVLATVAPFLELTRGGQRLPGGR